MARSESGISDAICSASSTRVVTKMSRECGPWELPTSWLRPSIAMGAPGFGTSRHVNLFMNSRQNQRLPVEQVGLPALLWFASQSGQLLDADIPELHWITMAGNSKVARAPVLAWVRMIRQKGGYVAQVRIENGRAVEFDLDRRSLHRDLFEVPLPSRPQITVVCANHPIGGAIHLPRVKALGLIARVIQNLDLAHTDVGRVARARIADG